MSDSTTLEASTEAVKAEVEQAVKAELAETEGTSPSDTQEADAPFGEAFQQLAEKKGFKSVDDLVSAYTHAEKFNTQLSQEIKGLTNEIRSNKVATPQSDPNDNLPPEQKKALDVLRSVVEDVVAKSLNPIKEDLETRKAREDINTVKGQFGVNDDDVDAALSIMRQRPGLSLEDAIKIATYDHVSKGAKLQQGRTEKTQSKQRAFSESARTSKTTGEIDYSKLSLEELEAILPSAGQFVDSKGVLRK